MTRNLNLTGRKPTPASTELVEWLGRIAADEYMDRIEAAEAAASPSPMRAEPTVTRSGFVRVIIVNDPAPVAELRRGRGEPVDD
jgi:hypothetical protein